MKSQDQFNLVSGNHDREIEEQWFDEAKRRLEELHNGKVDGIPAEEVFRTAHENLG